MKIVWHSNAPQCPSGYGSQTDIFTELIRDAGHDVAISANFGANGCMSEWKGMPVYPMDNEWGSRWLPLVAAHFSGEDLDPSSVQVITLMDVQVLASPLLKELNLAAWCPVDHLPCPPDILSFFKKTDATPIAMSRFGEEMLAAGGLEPLYVPHGVDTQKLRPVSRDRELLGITDDTFVVGMVAANQGNAPARKAFHAAFTAFGIFHKQHPDSVLYLHTDLKGPTGLDIPQTLELCGVPTEAVKVTPQFDLYLGIEYEAMAPIYSNMDVLLCPSYGEGFGIPIIEAQACGTPVIVNDFSAMPELCGAGWRIDGVAIAHEARGSYWQAPHIGSIVECLEAAHGEAAGLRDQAREFALGYDTRRVMDEHWTPVLAELEQRMRDRPVELKPKALAA